MKIARPKQQKWRKALPDEMSGFDALLTLPAFGEAPRGLHWTGDAEYCAPWTLLGFPAVMLREAHERPEGMDEGTVIMAGATARIADAVRVATERFARRGRSWRVAPDYDVDDVASKVVNAIVGYTDYVNRTVWRRRECGDGDRGERLHRARCLQHFC